MRGWQAVFLLLTVASPSFSGSPVRPQPAPADSTKVVLLGTGTWNLGSRAGPAVAVTFGSRLFIFDAGDGVIHQISAADLRVNEVEAAFLTTLRADHVIGLPSLFITPWENGRMEALEVYGPPGTRGMVEHLRAAYDAHIRERAPRVMPSGRMGPGRPRGSGGASAHEVAPGVIYDSAGVRVTAIAADHWPFAHDLGYRIDTPGRSVVISGDTRPTEAIVRAAAGVDVLVHNVYASGKVSDVNREAFRLMLSSAEEVGEVAARARPGLLVLTHMLPAGRYTDEELIAGVRKGGFLGRVAVGRDLDRY